PYAFVHTASRSPSHAFTTCFFFLMIRPPPSSTLFPYTTLFRSVLRLAAWSMAFMVLGTVLPHPRVPESVAIRSALFGAFLFGVRSEEHTSELQSLTNLVCRLLLEKKKDIQTPISTTTKLHYDGLTVYVENSGLIDRTRYDHRGNTGTAEDRVLDRIAFLVGRSHIT